jgi:hypothetical protein
MIILFTGHRDKHCNSKDLEKYRDFDPTALWIHGGAEGFDTQVENFAKQNNIETEIYYPDYAKYGKYAPLERNLVMLKDCNLVVACFDGRKSGGTYFTIRHGEEMGLRVERIEAIK